MLLLIGGSDPDCLRAWCSPLLVCLLLVGDWLDEAYPRVGTRLDLWARGSSSLGRVPFFWIGRGFLAGQLVSLPP